MEIVTVYEDWSRIKSGEFEAVFADLRSSDLEALLRATGYNNPTFFRLVDRSHNIFDPEEKERFHSELTRVFRADVPLTFLHPLTYTTIASTRIRGLDSSPYNGDLTRCMDELSLEEQA